MPKPDRPEVVDLNARRRAAEVQKQALNAATRSARKRSSLSPSKAWAVLLVIALVWAALKLAGGALGPASAAPEASAVSPPS